MYVNNGLSLEQYVFKQKIRKYQFGFCEPVFVNSDLFVMSMIQQHKKFPSIL